MLANRYLLALLLSALIFVVGPNRMWADDPGYGQPRNLELPFPDGPLNVRLWPWQEIDENTDLDSWVLESGLLAAPGEKVRDQKLKTNSIDELDAVFIARDLRRKRGRKRFSLLFACTYNDENEYARLVDIYGPLEALVNNKSEFWPLAQEMVKESCNEDPKGARNDAILAAISTKPGQGVKPEEIETVLAVMEEGYSGTFYQIEVDTYTLLKDGTVIRNPVRPLSDLDVEKSRELQPGKWSIWRKQGETYQIRRVNDEMGESGSNIDARWTPDPAPTGKRLSGTYGYAETSGNMFTGAFIYRGSYSFRKNGTYTSSTSSQYGGGDAMPEMGSVHTFSYCNEKGGSSTISATGPLTDNSGNITMTGTPSVVVAGTTDRDDCGDGKAGVYIIDGYTIELQANNGVTRRLPFYDLGNGWVVISSQYYAK